MAESDLLSPETLSPSPLAPAAEAVPASPAAEPVAGAPMPAAGQTLSEGQAGELFGHVAPPPGQAITPRRVQTQTIRENSDALFDAIAAGSTSNPQRSDTRRATIRSSAVNMLNAASDVGLTRENQFAYMLATAERESHIGNLMTEQAGRGGPEAYFDRKYGPNTAKGEELGNTEEGDGARYRGRGLVQITGRTNYADWTRRLNRSGVLHNGEAPDLVNHPEQAADPLLAARIAAGGMKTGSFTGRSLERYVNENQSDYRNARRVINGLDHADEIADRARAFEGIIGRNSDQFHGAVLRHQLSQLPSAREAAPLTGPGPIDSSMFSPTPLSNTPGRFGPMSELTRRPPGRFTPDPPQPRLPVNVPLPPRRPANL
jgi:hypothetical protein